MLLYMVCVYVPFLIMMVTRHNVRTTSLSAIGWISGGVQYLVLYLLLTLPYCLFLLFAYNRFYTNSHKGIKAVAVVSCVITTAGAFFPLRFDMPVLVFTHTLLSVGGAILLMLTILFALVMGALKSKYKAALIALCALYAAALAAAFYVLYTAALFQLMATAGFFCILLALNTVAVYRKSSRMIF